MDHSQAATSLATSVFEYCKNIKQSVNYWLVQLPPLEGRDWLQMYSANSLINNMNILMIPFFLSHFFTKSVREYL